MVHLARLFNLLRVLGRYRLDTFLQGHKGTLLLRCVLSPFFIGNRRYLIEPRSVRLRKAMEELGPIYVKFGQLLSTRRDFLPDDLAGELQALQDNVPPFESPSIDNILSEELDEKTQQIIAKVEPKPFASASVAQVHNATLKNGDRVVIKIIRPGIEKTIRKDLKLLRGIASLIQILSRTGRRLRLIEIIDDYEKVIFHELDLRSEAANTSQLARNFDSSQELYIPKVYWDFTRKNILVTEKINGIQVSNIEELKRHEIDLKTLAETGVNIFFTQVFEHNFFHADMHPGNIFVSTSSQQKPQYIAIDCAIMGTLSKQDQEYLARNLLAIFKRDYRKVAELHIESGWIPRGTKVQEFETAIRTVCEPIFEKPLREISFGKLLVQLFQTASRFEMEVQPSLVLLQKTLLNVEGLGRQLYPDLDLWQTALPYLENWHSRRINPLAFLAKIQESIPKWIDQLPDVPQLVIDSLIQNSTVGSLQSIVLRERSQKERAIKSKIRQKNFLGIMCVSLAALTFVSAPLNFLTSAPSVSIVLGGFGLYFLYFDR